ncbi:hypothetical protein ACRWZ2_24525, partial [Escherichia coli]
VTLKMPAFEWVHVQLHQQKGMISLSPPTICNSAPLRKVMGDDTPAFQDLYPGWFVSYKADVVEPGSKYASARYSRGNGALPKDCRIIFFHGKPRPREVSEDWLPLISSFFERESE